MMPPTASPQPIFNAPPVTIALCLFLGAVWAFLQVAPDIWAFWVLDAFALFPPAFMALGEPWLRLDTGLVAATLLTHAAIHLDGLHLLVNVGFLLAVGSMCERLLGRRRYLTLLVASALAGGIVQVLADWGAVVVIYGASGAVSGCLGGLARLALARGFPAARRFALAIIAMVLITNLLLAVFGGALTGSGAQIAWEAHLGGAVMGFLLGRPPRRHQPGSA